MAVRVLLNKNLWSLDSLDYPLDDGIVGQLPPDDVKENAETGVYADIAIPGRRFPRSQWIRGEAQSFEFTAIVVSDGTVNIFETDLDVVRKYRRRLKRAVAPVAELGRPERWRFVWGQIDFDCLVQSIGPIEYSNILRDGHQHMAWFSIVLKIIEPESPTADLEPVAPVPGTHVVVDGETYESIGAKIMGDPLYGVPMRQLSKVAFPQFGAVIAIVDAISLKRAGIAPVSLALQFTRIDVAAVTASLARARLG